MSGIETFLLGSTPFVLVAACWLAVGSPESITMDISPR